MTSNTNLSEAPITEPKSTLQNILCCECGILIQPNDANMCIGCIKARVDITEGIQRQVDIFHCSRCDRYCRPPYVHFDLESKEMLTFCLKQIKGLKSVKLIDALFVWTEPHSRRIKVKLIIQRDAFNITLQQSFVVEFFVRGKQCDDCRDSFTTDPGWKALVQVRQKVEHKRTFFYLEQIILKHKLFRIIHHMNQEDNGLDFFFSTHSGALSFLDFIQSVVPMKSRSSKKLIGMDIKSNIANFRYTSSTEICPVCRDDLVCLPGALSTISGGIGPLLLCIRLTADVRLIDPFSLRSFNLSSKNYWRYPFDPVLNSRDLTEFVVLDILKTIVPKNERNKGFNLNKTNPTGAFSTSHCMADITVARVIDLGNNDTNFTTTTHLGHLLQAGDYVLGYDLTSANINEALLAPLKSKGIHLPDVVLVRKHYASSKRKSRRNWKLKELGTVRNDRRIQKDDNDMECLMEELEDDPVLRKNVNIYSKNNGSKRIKPDDRKMNDDNASESDDENYPTIPNDELLDEDIELFDKALKFGIDEFNNNNNNNNMSEDLKRKKDIKNLNDSTDQTIGSENDEKK